MAFKAGKDSWIGIDSPAGAIVNVSTYADSFDFPQPVDTLDVSTFGDAAKDFIPGLTDGGVINISGPADVAMGTFIASLKAAQAAGSSTASVIFGPGGSVAGQIRVNAETYVSAYNLSTGVSGRVEFTASLQVTGAVTNTTW